MVPDHAVTLQRGPLRSSLTSHRARLSHEKLLTITHIFHSRSSFQTSSKWFHFVNIQDASAWVFEYTLQERASRLLFPSWPPSPLCQPRVGIDVIHVTMAPRPSPTVFVYCEQLQTSQ